MTVIYEKTIKVVEDIEVHDCLEICDVMYEVVSAEPNRYDDIVLNLDLIAVKQQQTHKPKATAMLIIPKTVMVTTLK